MTELVKTLRAWFEEANNVLFHGANPQHLTREQWQTRRATLCAVLAIAETELDKQEMRQRNQ